MVKGTLAQANGEDDEEKMADGDADDPVAQLEREKKEMEDAEKALKEEVHLKHFRHALSVNDLLITQVQGLKSLSEQEEYCKKLGEKLLERLSRRAKGLMSEEEFSQSCRALETFSSLC